MVPDSGLADEELSSAARLQDSLARRPQCPGNGTECRSGAGAAMDESATSGGTLIKTFCLIQAGTGVSGIHSAYLPGATVAPVWRA